MNTCYVFKSLYCKYSEPNVESVSQGLTERFFFHINEMMLYFVSLIVGLRKTLRSSWCV